MTPVPTVPHDYDDRQCRDHDRDRGRGRGHGHDGGAQLLRCQVHWLSATSWKARTVCLTARPQVQPRAPLVLPLAFPLVILRVLALVLRQELSYAPHSAFVWLSQPPRASRRP